MKVSIRQLNADERRLLDDQLAAASEFARSYDPEAEGGRASLESFDRAFAAFLASGDHAEANDVVQAIGAVFGAELVERLGFEWVIVTDEHGTELAVSAQPGRSEVTIFPADFVAKRYERGEAPFLVAALVQIKQHLQRIAED